MPSPATQLHQAIVSLHLPGTVHIGPATIEPLRRLATGIDVLDSLLEGGLPRGHLSEIVGAPSAGTTALTCSLLSASTRRGEVTAVVDLPDALHPGALRTAGADLERVLWVRPPSLPTALKCAELILAAGGFGLVVLDLGLPDPRSLPLRVWPRLNRKARQADAALAVLAHRRVAGSFAALSLSLTLQRVRWERNLFEGLLVRTDVVRNRLGRPGRSGKLELGCDS